MGWVEGRGFILSNAMVSIQQYLRLEREGGVIRVNYITGKVVRMAEA